MQEYGLLLESMQSLSKHGIPVVVVDGGSGKEFINNLKGLSNLILCEWDKYEKNNLMAQVKLSLKTARNLGARYVLYTEPDKKLFFEHRLNDFIARTPINNQVGMAVASRTVKSFSSFPEFQKCTEKAANEICSKAIGLNGDFTYGPLLIDTAIIPCLDIINENIGWGWRFFTIAVSHRLGRPISQIYLDLPCPIDQCNEDSEEARIYRMQQLIQNIQGLVFAFKVPFNQIISLYQTGKHTVNRLKDELYGEQILAKI